MTIEEVIEELCSIVACVYHTQADYSHASDGFCKECTNRLGHSWHFQHEGKTLEYVKQAVLEKLVRDGFTPDLTVFTKPDEEYFWV